MSRVFDVIIDLDPETAPGCVVLIVSTFVVAR